jgi:Thioredoxin-like
LLRAYEHYKNKNFAVVSISLDKSPDAVTQYRHMRWAMPWANLFLPGGQKSQTAKDFDMDWIGLPRLILVDNKGTVVALQDDLGRDTLARTLAKYLKD